MKLIMPMAGNARRFNENSQEYIVKPLIEVKGKKLHQWAISSFNGLEKNVELIFIIQKKHTGLKEDLFRNYPASTIVEIDRETRGPSETLSLAADHLDNSPVIVCDCDLYFQSEPFLDFLQSSRPADTGLLTFTSQLPLYSYVKTENGYVMDIAEKIVISDSAVCGAYYFRSGEELLKLIRQTLFSITEREVYLSDLIKSSIKSGLRCRAFPCSTHVSLGTPEEITKNFTLLPDA